MDSKEPQDPRLNVEIIQRRIRWLEKRIEQARRDKRTAHFDISERIALIWALEQIKLWVDLGPEDGEDV